jgi:hypothetical protein
MRARQLYHAISEAVAIWSSRPLEKRGTAPCNNSPQLCDRSYGNITHLGAHDSPFVSNASNSYAIAGNQFYTSPVQLDGGVRLLTGQIQVNAAAPTELRLCHTACALYDGGTLVDWLSSIKSWLDQNPNDVVSLLFVNGAGASSAAVDSTFKASGISKYAFAPSFTSPPDPSSWPTLSSLISANTRLITFIDSLPSGDTGVPHILSEFTYVFENPYNVTSPGGFSCDPQRPPSLASASQALASNMLFLQNHFLDYALGTTGITVPNVTYSNTTNSPDASLVGSLASAASQCAGVYGRAPNFLLVDWFNNGPALATVDALNGVTATVAGRTGPGASGNANTTGASSGQSSGGSSGGSSPSGGQGTAAKGMASLKQASSVLLGVVVLLMALTLSN